MASRRYRRPRRPSLSKLQLGLLVLLILAVLLVLERLGMQEAKDLKSMVLSYTGLAPATRPLEPDFTCSVARVSDGDSLRCLDGTRVRLHAVAAREADETCSEGHPCPSASAAAATRALTQIAAGKTLSCMQTGTSYNRVTAICWTPQNIEVNCAMIQSGTTEVWERFNREEPICRNPN